MLPEVAALVVVRLQVEQVEGLLAGAQHQGDGVAVPQGELQLHVDLLGRLARDPVGAEPVVLAVLHHVADLEGPDGGVVLIHPTDLLPLKKMERKRRVGGRWRTEMERDEEGGCQRNGGTKFIWGKKEEEDPKDGGRREKEQPSAKEEGERQRM